MTDACLVTGATSFLGYHVVRRLNASGLRPRVLERRDAATGILERLDVDRRHGHLEDPGAVRAACAGVDTLLHLAFKVSVGGGEPPTGFRSSSSRSIAIDTHDGMVATRLARYPSRIDLSCGRHSGLAAGTCCRTRREMAASRSS